VNKRELVRQYAANHEQTLALLGVVDPEAVIYDETGWRVKDIAAHVATWDAEALRSFHAARRGTVYSIPNFVDVDDFNGYAATQRMDEPMERILADWDATRSWLNIIFNAMSEDEWNGEMTYPSGRRGTARALAEELLEHEVTHMDEIRARLGLR
jgi:hypothetical protein